MLTKIALAVLIIAGTASASLAAPKHFGKVSEPTYFKYATGAEWWKI